jgi:hypothetical protein
MPDGTMPDTHFQSVAAKEPFEQLCPRGADDETIPDTHFPAHFPKGGGRIGAWMRLGQCGWCGEQAISDTHFREDGGSMPGTHFRSVGKVNN